MGVITLTQEFTTPVAPSKMFKALILDSHLIPKLVPQSIKSIELVQGDGGVGSIKQTNLADQGSRYKNLKHRIDALDTENYVCKYTLIEGDVLSDRLESIAYHEVNVLGDTLESIAYEVKFEAAGGGSVCKMKSHYHTKGDIELKEEEIKYAKGKVMWIYKVVEEYLLANPDLYA